MHSAFRLSRIVMRFVQRSTHKGNHLQHYFHHFVVQYCTVRSETDHRGQSFHLRPGGNSGGLPFVQRRSLIRAMLRGLTGGCPVAIKPSSRMSWRCFFTAFFLRVRFGWVRLGPRARWWGSSPSPSSSSSSVAL